MAVTERSSGLAAAITAAGGVRKLSEFLGISHAAVSRWKEIPVRHIPVLEERYRIPRHQLRPDIYPPERERARRRRPIKLSYVNPVR